MHRRHLTAALAMAGALGLAACGGTATEPAGQPGTLPTSAEPTPAESSTTEPTPNEAPTVDPDPSPTDPQAATGDCSASGLDGDADFAGVGGEVASQAHLLLDAATSCDQDSLVAAATQGEARLTFGNLTPEEFFALPEDADPDGLGHYEVIARLLAGTSASPDPDNDLIVWPAVFHAPDVEANWDELVDAGLYTPQQVERLQSGDYGYLGWRLGISGEGELQFIVAGD